MSLDVLEIPWSDEGPMTFYVDPDDGDICLELPDVDFAITMTAEDWLQVVEFVTKERLRRMC